MLLVVRVTNLKPHFTNKCQHFGATVATADFRIEVSTNHAFGLLAASVLDNVLELVQTILELAPWISCMWKVSTDSSVDLAANRYICVNHSTRYLLKLQNMIGPAGMNQYTYARVRLVAPAV